MLKRILPLLLLSLLLLSLPAQNTLSLNGLNEAKFIYRTSEDSLHAYFTDSFAFNLGYRNFSFGMKFIAELPKHPVEQTEIYDELNPESLVMAWKELYATYSKDAFSFHAGTTEETFGNGIVFRSFQDTEFDLDHRIESFLFKYDNKLKLKALYGAVESENYQGLYDLAYGADAQYPLFEGINLGASAVSYRDLYTSNAYSKRDVFGGRMSISKSDFDLQAEYAISKLYHLPNIESLEGRAVYINGVVGPSKLTIGAAYMLYDDFLYRLHDLPLANHHNETLSDAQATGLDEEGVQGFATYMLNPNLNVNIDYAEAWNSDKTRKMNDAYASLDWTGNASAASVSYGHIEKVDENNNTWQQDLIPAVSGTFSVAKIPVMLQAEYKMVSKQHGDISAEHAEPRLQADLSLDKLSLSLGVQSHWDELSEIMESDYWPFVEGKYPLAGHTDLTVFAGKEAGGKVCRNGVCRYVAAFEGLKVELSTRF